MVEAVAMEAAVVSFCVCQIIFISLLIYRGKQSDFLNFFSSILLGYDRGGYDRGGGGYGGGGGYDRGGGGYGGGGGKQIQVC